MTRNLLIAATALLIAASTNAQAGTKYDPDRRAEAEAARIETGRRTGSITYFEGLDLRREQADIARKEAEFRADGYLSQGERRELKRLQDQADRHIDQLDSNGHRRWWILPRVGK